jgi:diacylglycerol kinase family enzyme
VEKSLVLLNPSSGQGRSLGKKRKIEKIFQDRNIPHDLVISTSEDDLRHRVAAAVSRYANIVGVGGDTTFNIIAEEILNHINPGSTTPRLGMIGTGSVNDVCRGLGIEKPEVLGDCLVNESVRRMDAGLVEISGIEKPYYFLGSLSVGLGTVVNRYVDRVNRKHRRLTRFIPGSQVMAGGLGVFEAFSQNRVPLTLNLSGDDFREDISFSVLVFLNTRFYAMGLELNDRSTPFDGQIDCAVLNTASVKETWLIRRELERGRKQNLDDIRIISSSCYEITADPELDIQVDGEIIEHVSQFRVSVLPGALKVFTPPANGQGAAD